MTDYDDDYDEEDDLDLNTLPDDELVEQMHDDLYNGLKEEIAEGTEILLARGWDANKVLNEALVAGMTIVGIDFRDGILFVPEVLMSANAMKAGMAVLKPLLSQSAIPLGLRKYVQLARRTVYERDARDVSAQVRHLPARQVLEGRRDAPPQDAPPEGAR